MEKQTRPDFLDHVIGVVLVFVFASVFGAICVFIWRIALGPISNMCN